MQKILFCLIISVTLLSAQNTIWSYHATGSLWTHFRSTRTISDVDGDLHDDVIAVSENDTLYCLSGMTGVRIWHFVADPCYVERGLISVPDLNGDTIADVVLGTVWGTRSVFAISGANGDTIWQYDTHEYGSGGWIYEVAPMADVDGDSIVDILASTGGTDAERAYLFSGATGTKIWEYHAGFPCFGIRSVGDVNGDDTADVAVPIGDGGAGVLVLDGANGGLIRDIALSSSGLTAVSIGDINNDAVPDFACGTSSSGILALSGADGSTLWNSSVPGMIWDLHVLPDVDTSGYPELLPSGVSMNSFYCIDAFTGNIVWSTPAVDQIFVNVAIADINNDSICDVIGGTGYNNNVLYALNGSSGAIFWQRSMNSPVESAYWIEDIDGNDIPDLLAGTREGWLYAIDDGFVGISENDIAGVSLNSLTSRFGRLEIAHNFPGNTQLRVEIHSILGQKIIDISIRADQNPVVINANRIPAGVYFASVDSGESSEILKFVVFD
jgi:outer membrane protein assembly factor BamB